MTATQAVRKDEPELHRVAISTWLEPTQALAESRRSPAYLATLHLDVVKVPLARVALTEHYGDGHVDVWGHPTHLGLLHG